MSEPRFKPGERVIGVGPGWGGYEFTIVGLIGGRYIITDKPGVLADTQQIWAVDESCRKATKLEKALK